MLAIACARRFEEIVEDSHMNVQKLFAERIGGEQFGKVQQTFKFTLINNAKLEFMRKNPTVKVIDMGVGEPEEIPAESIIHALDREARVKENRIYPCNGIQAFSDAAARYLQRAFSLSMDPKTEIMHCVGTKTALAQIPLAFVNPGDAVLTTTPGYPVLPRVAEWLGARLFQLPLEAKNNYMPESAQFEALIKRERPKLVLLNYPNNPTGAVASREFFERVVQLAHEYSFLVVQDAAYADYVFEGDFISPLHIPGGKEVTLELYSLSKSYNMQGYRLGFVTGGAPLVKAFGLVKDNTDNGQFIAIQRAGIHALDSCQEFLAANKRKYARRLERVASILSRAGIEARSAPGTFYLYVQAPESFRGQRVESAQHLADMLIGRYGLITVPWDEAGPCLRFSMTFEVGTKDFASEDEVFQALEERLVHDRLA
jgi:LL-diaminopimelate aminotransferase